MNRYLKMANDAWEKYEQNPGTETCDFYHTRKILLSEKELTQHMNFKLNFHLKEYR